VFQGCGWCVSAYIEMSKNFLEILNFFKNYQRFLLILAPKYIAYFNIVIEVNNLTD
jgi:hypothetical protein